MLFFNILFFLITANANSFENQATKVPFTVDCSQLGNKEDKEECIKIQYSDRHEVKASSGTGVFDSSIDERVSRCDINPNDKICKKKKNKGKK